MKNFMAIEATNPETAIEYAEYMANILIKNLEDPILLTFNPPTLKPEERLLVLNSSISQFISHIPDDYTLITANLIGLIAQPPIPDQRTAQIMTSLILNSTPDLIIMLSARNRTPESYANILLNQKLKHRTIFQIENEYQYRIKKSFLPVTTYQNLLVKTCLAN